jgi:hypothetical protein
VGAALFSYRFTILTYGQQKTRNVKEIIPMSSCHFLFLKVLEVDSITFRWTEASDLKTRSMVDSVAMSGWGSLDPQNLHKNSKYIKFM